MIGHLHPVILHFPIALFIFCVVYELYRKYVDNQTTTNISGATEVALGIGMLTSIVTVGSGWIGSQDYGVTTEMTIHQWLGTASAVWSIVCTAMVMWKFKGRWKIQMVFLASLALLISAAAHFGGIIVHGNLF